MSPDLLERTRMALAEAGYDPSAAFWSETEGFVRVRVSIPRIDRWRAASIARSSFTDQICWACRNALPVPTTGEMLGPVRDACRADRPCVMDCGMPR